MSSRKALSTEVWEVVRQHNPDMGKWVDLLVPPKEVAHMGWDTHMGRENHWEEKQ